MPLTPKQQRFAQEYPIDSNATKASIRAGYSAATAAQTGYKLLKLPEVTAIIEAATKRRLAKIEIDADFVLQGLARIARANMMDLMQVDQETGRATFDLAHAPAEVLETIASIEEEERVERTGSEKDDFEKVRRLRVKLHDKHAALVALGRHLKLFTDKSELTGPGGGPIEVEVTDARAKLAAQLGRAAPQPPGS